MFKLSRGSRRSSRQDIVSLFEVIDHVIEEPGIAYCHWVAVGRVGRGGFAGGVRMCGTGAAFL